MEKDFNPEKRLTEQEVSEMYSIGIEWLRKHRRPGSNGPTFYKIDPDKPKSGVRYKWGDCEKFFNKGKTDPRAA